MSQQKKAIEILSSDDSDDIISISSRDEIISIGSSSSSDSEKKKSSAYEDNDAKSPPGVTSHISSDKSNNPKKEKEEQSKSDNDDGNEKISNAKEAKPSLSEKAPVARNDVVSLPSSSDDEDGIISVFEHGTTEDVAIYIGDSEPSVLCMSSSDDDSENLYDDDNEITFLRTNASRYYNSAVYQKMAPRKTPFFSTSSEPDEKYVEPVDIGSSNSTPIKSPMDTSVTKLQAKVEKKEDKESSQEIVGMEIDTSVKPQAAKFPTRAEKEGQKSSQSATQSVMGIDASVQDQDTKPQTRIEKETSSHSPIHRPSKEIDKSKKLQSRSEKEEDKETSMKNPPSGLLPLPVNSQDPNSQKTVSAGVKIKTSLKRTIANTDNISKKLRRLSRATKSSSPSMEKLNEVQSSLDKVQKNQTKMKKDMLRRALNAKNEMLSKVISYTDAKQVPTLLPFVKEKPLEAEYLKHVDYPIPRDTTTTIFVQRSFAESGTKVGAEDHKPKEKYDYLGASDEMAVYEEEERDKEISLVLKNSTHIEEKILHEHLATLLNVKKSHIKYLSEKLNQKLEVFIPDNPYERQMSTFRDLFCQRCMVYDCFVHGSKRGNYSPQLQAEIALLKEESGYWADGASLTCQVIGEAKSSPPRKWQEKKELVLSEAQQVLGQRLSHIFGGDLNHVASALGVSSDLIDKRIKSEPLEYQFIDPKKVDQTKFRNNRGKNSTVFSRARSKVKRIPFPFPCYHTEPCSEKVRRKCCSEGFNSYSKFLISF